MLLCNKCIKTLFFHFLLGLSRRHFLQIVLQTVKFHRTQSYISDKCITHFFFFFFLLNRKSINGANYICTKCTQVDCWLQIDPVCLLHITQIRKGARPEEKGPCRCVYIQNCCTNTTEERKMILHLGRNTENKSIYIAQFRHIYIYIYYISIHIF